MKVLVVGGSGFIGRHFLLKAPSEWDCYATYHKSTDFIDFVGSRELKNVTPVQADLTTIGGVVDLLCKAGETFDVCLYAMGNSDIAMSYEEPVTDLTTNVNSLLNLLQSTFIKKLIFMSSGSVYEGYKGLVNPSLPVNPTTPYSISKLASERYIEHFQKNTNHLDNYICLRFFGAYGPMELPRKIYTNLVKAFGLNHEDTFTIKGDGKNYIDAMYIDDAIEGIIKMIKSDKSNKILDYCVGSPLTINELIHFAAKTFNKDFVLHHDKAPAAEYTTFYASPLEVKALYGFIPQRSLQRGLKRFGRYLEETCQS